jgi:hypothetical protein
MDINPLILIGALAFVAGALSARWYAKTKRPIIALLAGALFLLALVAFWRTFVPPPEHHPGMR